MGAEMNNKRKRDPVFQFREKNHLVDLVEEYFNILECKKTDCENEN